ncbi:hypothetical protein [Methanoregula sp.]|nr:hypothetical protein [Methanoregula sp.]
MTLTKTIHDYPVFLRAVEGLPVLVLIVGCFALSWLLHREPAF